VTAFLETVGKKESLSVCRKSAREVWLKTWKTLHKRGRQVLGAGFLTGKENFPTGHPKAAGGREGSIL